MGRILKKGLGLLLGVCLLAGCAAGQEPPPPQEGQPLVLWSYYETPAQRAALDTLVTRFNLAQKDYLLRWAYIPMTDFQRQISLGMAGGELPDLVLVDNPDMPENIDTGLFEDITQEVEGFADSESYFPQVWDTVMRDGRCYGLPFCCNNVALVYNKEALASVGVAPPGTTREFLEAARQLSGGEGAGFALSALWGEQGAFQFLPWVLPRGEASPQVGGEQTREGLALLSQMTREGLLPKDCINWSQVDVARAFIDGQCAMMENGPWVLPMLEEAGISYGIVPLPFEKNAVITGGENFGIIKGKNKAGALAVLEYYNTESIMRDICAQGVSIPPRRALARSLYQDDPDMRVFVEQMEMGVSRTQVASWATVSQQLGDVMYSIVGEGADPQQEYEKIWGGATG